MENLKIVEGLRTVSMADDVLSGMGLCSAEWRQLCANQDILRHLRINNTTKEVYFLGYVAVQFVADECVHISVAIGEPGEIHIKQGCREPHCPTVYNATRDLGRSLCSTLSQMICKKVNVDIAALIYLSRLIPGIPQGDPREDKGLHMSLFNKYPGCTAPATEGVKELQRMFGKGVALQLDFADFKIVKGSRCNDMPTGGMYYLACGMSEKLAILCSLIRDRFADSIKGYAPHMSLELWGVAACRHPQQKLGEGGDLKFWYCDFLRWGIANGVFENCLDSDGKFDIARYMYIRTHDKLADIDDVDKAKVSDTMELMNGFEMTSIEAFIEMVDGCNGFGSIKANERLHDKDSPVYKFFQGAPVHPGVDCVLSRIKNCATAAGKCPRWFPGTKLALPTPDMQSHILSYIRDAAHGAPHDIYTIKI